MVFNVRRGMTAADGGETKANDNKCQKPIWKLSISYYSDYINIIGQTMLADIPLAFNIKYIQKKQNSCLIANIENVGSTGDCLK